MSEQELLDAALAGRFACDERGNLFSVINGGRRRLHTFLDPQGRPCCKFYLNGGRRTTTVGRAVWVIANRRPVPVDMAVDHVNRNSHDNRPANLRLLDFSLNSSQNQWHEDDF